MSLLSKFNRKRKSKKDKSDQSEASTASATMGVQPGPPGSSGVDRVDQGDSMPSLASIDIPTDLFGHKGSSRSFEEASEIAEQLLGIVKDISEATELLAPLKSASALMIRGSQAFRNLHNNAGAWIDLCDDLTLHVNQIQKWKTYLEERPDSSNRSCLESLATYSRSDTTLFDTFKYSRSHSIAAEIIRTATEYESRRNTVLGGLQRAGTAQAEQAEIVRQQQRLASAWQAFVAAMNMEALQGVDRIEAHLKESDVFMQSPAAFNPRTVYGNKIDVCEEGTRTEVLAIIRKWAVDIGTEKQIFWLNDAAGTGKSTIAATMAREWYQTHMLAGRFFFSPNDVRERTTDNFCLTMAEDIAVNQPEMSGVIRRAIKSTPRDHFPFDQQFEKLLVEPLQTYSGNHSLCMIIDALDNCAKQQEREQFLELLLHLLPSIRLVKVFMTSRPIQDISDFLQGRHLVTGDDIQLLDIHNPPRQDITLYVEKRLGNSSRVQIEEAYRKMVVEQSGGLFLFAATVCRMLKCAKIEQRPAILDVLKSSKSPLALEEKMDELYFTILKQANGSDTAAEPLMDVLLLILVAFQPISINTIRSYLPNGKYVADIVQDLGAVLKDGTPDRPIKVLHPTFREFLLSGAGRARTFMVDPDASHAKMSHGCLGALKRSLRYNILHLERPEQLGVLNDLIPDLERRLQTYTTADTHYASSFWVHHVEALEIPRTLWSIILRLLGKSLLNWVELMSYSGGLVSCIDSLSRLRLKAKRAFSEDPSILTADDLVTIRHAHQFVVNYQQILSQSALQAYCIPLFFTPPQSPIFGPYREQYHTHLPKILTPHVVQWGNHISLGKHRFNIETVTLSLDGTRIITYGVKRPLPSFDRSNFELFLWDTETGALMRTLCEERVINSPIFSTNGQHLAFATIDKLHIHLSKSGNPAIPPLKIDPYAQFTFSCIQTYITIARDQSAELFSIETGQQVRIVEFGQRADSISFSPDGRKICAISFRPFNTTFSLWNWETFELISTVAIIELDATGVFSADGTRFATWQQWGHSKNQVLAQTIRLWNVSSEGLIEMAQISDTNIYRISFSPSGGYLVAQNLHHELKIWDFESQNLISTFSAPGRSSHSRSPPSEIYFSPDGQRLGIFLNRYLEGLSKFDVWAFPSGKALESIIPDHIVKGASQVVPSIDWTKLVSVIGTNQLEIHDLQEESTVGSIQDFSSMIFYFTISHAGPMLAVVDESGKSLQLWDVTSGSRDGENLTRLGRNEEELIRSIALSSNGRMIAEARGSRVFIWDIDTRQREEMSHDVNSPVMSLNFSPNSGLLAIEFKPSSGSFTLCVWDVHTQTSIWRQSSNGISAWYSFWLGFSPDSSHILSFNEHHIYIAHLNTGDEISGLHTRQVYYIRGAFSPTGTAVAVLAAEKTQLSAKRLEIRELSTTLPLVDCILFTDVSNEHQLTFSRDGKYIACGPLCWDISSTPAQLYTGQLPPASFEKTWHSFLSFKDGWIQSAYPPGPLLPIPGHFQGRIKDPWYLCGDYAILKSSQGGPMVIDCSPWLARLREKV
ncbi:hypothetical protein FRB91_005182 [Serendipita sp. 411]|nr:hypothetical protein FRB91_005182 [Serendipita sp. 411]